MIYPNPEKHVFQPQQLIEESLHIFKLDKNHKHIILRHEDDLVAPVTVTGDPEVFRKIFRLLLNNAADHVQATKITVSLKQILQTDTEVLLEFSFTDNGLREEELTESGFSHKRGLVSARAMVEQQGGKVDIISTSGVGTIFKFLVKFQCAPAVKESLPEDFGFNSLAGKRILVAEDNELNQKIIARVLHNQHMEVDIASNGKEAVELFERNGSSYDLLILDLQMPHMDGFQVANYIRRKLRSTLPIVAMTASAYPNEHIRCFEAGINQYLSKPFKPDELYSHLRYFLLEEHQVIYKRSEQDVTHSDSYSLSSLHQTSDNDYVVEILELFLENTPVLIKEVEEVINQEDWEYALKQTAKLKGSLGVLQMQRMINIVSEIELKIREDEMEGMEKLVQQLKMEYMLVSPMLMEELNGVKIERA